MKTPATAHLLLSGLILAGLALLGPRLDRVFTHSSPAQIVVQADQTLAPVNPLLFGQNFGPWMHTTETYVAQYQDVGVALLRFPAGNWGDEHDLYPNNLDDLGALADALQGTTWQGLIGNLEDPRPVYDVYRLYARWGTAQVAAESSDEPLLPAFASLRDDRRLAILVVNKDPTLAREATLTVEGFRPAGQAQVWLQDEQHLGTELPAIAVAETFPYTFPPYSVTLFILEPAPQSRWILWAGLGLLAVTLAVLATLGRWVWRPR